MRRAIAQPITISPEWRAWRDALAARPSRGALEFRRELGLPTDRPIVMSGHQPTIWHPGILAKWLATLIAADRYDATPVWVVVDHDMVDPFALRVPVLAEGRLEARTIRLDAAGSGAIAREALPALSMPARRVTLGGLGESLLATPASVAEGLEAIVGAMNAHADEPNAAMQAAGAVRDLASTLTSDGVSPALVGVVRRWERMIVVPATALARTTLFARVLRRFEADDAREAYGAAAHAFPTARIRSLTPGELPAWEIMGGVRRAARAGAPAAGPEGSRAILAPRALTLTFLIRAAACELFIHGLGGGGDDGAAGYDRVMERWARALFPDLPLAPTATVSATLRLPLTFPAADADREQRLWIAHRARHDPRVLGDDALERARGALLSELNGAERGSPRRRELYARLHRTLDQYRVAHARELSELDAAAARARAMSSSSHIAHDRTWAFPLYSRPALLGLLGPIRARIAPWEPGA